MEFGTFHLYHDDPVLVLNTGSMDNILVYNPIRKAREYVAKKDVLPLPEELNQKAARELINTLPHSIWAYSSYGNGMTGTDPEIFAFTAKGKLIPAWKFLKSNKEDKVAYWDGPQAEISTNPSHCHSYVVDSIHNNLRHMYYELMKVDKTAQLVTQDVVKLDKEVLQLSEDEHISLGCSPSKNAYPETKHIDVKDPRKHLYRYAGCHLHHSDTHSKKPDWFPDGTVVMMDKTIGVLLTALGRDLENPIRRKAYGRPGEYRLPSKTDCRLEYRTPGSFLLHHPALFNLGADMSRAGYRMGLLMDGRKMPLPDVRKIITECDADAAVAYIKKYQSMFEAMFGFGTTVQGSYNVAKTLDITLKGIKASGLFPDSVVNNWRLNKTDWIEHNGNKNCTWQSAVANLY